VDIPHIQQIFTSTSWRLPWRLEPEPPEGTSESFHVLVVVILLVGSSFQSLMVKGKMSSSMHRLRSCNGRTSPRF